MGVFEAAFSRDLINSGVNATYEDGTTVPLLRVLLAEYGVSQAENSEEFEGFTRIAVVDISTDAVTINTRGRFVIGNDTWQVIKPLGRDSVVQSWRVGIKTTNAKRKAKSRL